MNGKFLIMYGHDVNTGQQWCSHRVGNKFTNGDGTEYLVTKTGAVKRISPKRRFRDGKIRVK